MNILRYVPLWNSVRMAFSVGEQLDTGWENNTWFDYHQMALWIPYKCPPLPQPHLHWLSASAASYTLCQLSKCRGRFLFCLISVTTTEIVLIVYEPFGLPLLELPVLLLLLLFGFALTLFFFTEVSVFFFFLSLYKSQVLDHVWFKIPWISFPHLISLLFFYMVSHFPGD